MIIHVLDRNFNALTTIDTESNGLVLSDVLVTTKIVNGTILSTLDATVLKEYEDSEHVNLGKYLVFQNENGKNVCTTISATGTEDEFERPIVSEDLGMELLNGSATTFTSNNEQYIDYYVNRELFDTGWTIGINEIQRDIKRKGDFSQDETPLSRLQGICQLFDCEMTFTVEFQNLKITKKNVNIHRKVGTNKTNKVFYSGKDVVTIQKSTDLYEIITAIEDKNDGFNQLGMGDGRFFTRKGESIVYDRESNAIYGRGNTFEERFTGFIMGEGESHGTAEIDNYNEMRAILEERSQPSFKAEVDLLFHDGDFEVGDWLTFVDEDYKPALRMKARIIEKHIYPDDQAKNKVVIGNYQLLRSMLSSNLLAKQDQLSRPTSIYMVKLSSDSSTIFHAEEDRITVVMATITKNGVDITQTITPEDVMWFKVDRDGNHDREWEAANSNSGTIVNVDSKDVMDACIIKCVLTKFDNHFVQAIYFLNGLKEVARKALRLQGPDTVTSVHISDTHFATDTITRDDLENYNRTTNHIKNVVELTNFIDVDYIVLNGDVHDGSTANKNIAKSNYAEAVNTLGMSACPYFVSWGNHCNNSYGDGRTNSINKVYKNYQPSSPMTGLHGKGKTIITNKEMYEIATRPSTIFNIVENENDKMGYYYYDVPDKKMRVIILNCQDIPDTLDVDGYMKYNGINVAGYRQQQITWFYETLKSTPEDVTVAVYQHYSFGKRYSTSMAYLAYNYEMIDGIVNTFVTGGKYSRSYTENADFKASISTDFEGRKGKLAFLAHGHHHNDRISKDTNGIVDYSISCSVSRPKKDQRDRPLGALEEDLWDIVVLNTKTRKVDLIRFGAGSDRSFEY